MGRPLWGVHNTPGIWSGDIWSKYNSQFVADPYSFTHVTHGTVFYGLLALAVEKQLASNKADRRGCRGVRLGSSRKLGRRDRALSNGNDFSGVFRRQHRELDVGHSLLYRRVFRGFPVPKRVTIAGTIAVEVILALWIRDNLTLNIIMLLFPSEAIKAWQMGIKGI